MINKKLATLTLFFCFILITGCTTYKSSPGLYSLAESIQNKKIVDLTHTFYPGIPHWPGFPDEKRETLYWYEKGVGTKGSGFYAEYYCHVGQWGTHVDPPAHFVKNLRTLDQIRGDEMIMPLVVIDVHQKVLLDPDYTLKMNDIKEWEDLNGKIPPKSFVVMRTDWSDRWPSIKKIRNEDQSGTAHYPGWSLETLKYLYEVVGITASGHETTDTDPGFATSKGDYSLEAYILGRDHYQIELLTGLKQVPQAGAMAFVSFPKPKNGSGFPARVIAILP